MLAIQVCQWEAYLFERSEGKSFLLNKGKKNECEVAKTYENNKSPIYEIVKKKKEMYV